MYIMYIAPLFPFVCTAFHQTPPSDSVNAQFATYIWRNLNRVTDNFTVYRQKAPFYDITSHHDSLTPSTSVSLLLSLPSYEGTDNAATAPWIKWTLFVL